MCYQVKLFNPIFSLKKEKIKKVYFIKKIIVKMNNENSLYYIRLYSLIGIIIAAYSYYVKIQIKKRPKTYKALCDINDSMSCSRVLTSEYGSGFGIIGKIFGEKSFVNISNSLLGIAFYSLQFCLSKI
jgi:uncharacterized membrane protein